MERIITRWTDKFPGPGPSPLEFVVALATDTRAFSSSSSRVLLKAQPAYLGGREARIAKQAPHHLVMQWRDMKMVADKAVRVDVYQAGQKDLEVRVQSAPLKPYKKLAISLEVCELLRQFHDLGFVHADLKPKNIVYFMVILLTPSFLSHPLRHLRARVSPSPFDWWWWWCCCWIGLDCLLRLVDSPFYRAIFFPWARIALHIRHPCQRFLCSPAHLYCYLSVHALHPFF